MSKIYSLEELTTTIATLKAQGKRIVHCHGVFDLLHIGHIRYFENAKKFGDILVVTLTPDKYVNKGPHRPIFSQDLRAEAIAALAVVDFVAVNLTPTAVEAIHQLRPDFYVKGPDYKNKDKDYTHGIIKEEEAVNAVSGKLVFTDDITFSSTAIINQAFPVFQRETAHYLHGFRTRHRLEHIIEAFDALRPLKVLVVGEAIIDKYIYCETLGKSGKEPVLVAQQISQEIFAGGVLAVANHLASFCDTVGLLTCLGKDSEWNYESFIQQKLKSNIERFFLPLEKAPTIVKRRFVETYPFQKIFETYTMDDELTARDTDALCEKLMALIPHYDCIIVTDYGHGLIGKEVVSTLCQHAPFLAVNTQVNAGNHGFCTVSKYHRAHFVSISEREIRLEARNRRGPLRDIMEEVAKKLSCPSLLVTRGGEGCVCYQEGEGFFEVPAFATKVVDRVGSGDALFAISSLLVAKGMPMEAVGLVANAVGAQAVMIVGNKTSIERDALLKHIESLLK